jgi:hypothetical protein
VQYASQGTSGLLSVWSPELGAIDKRFFQTILGREAMIGEDEDARGQPVELNFMTREAFLQIMAGELTVKVKSGAPGKERIEHKDAALLWITHPARRRFWGVQFDPSAVGHGRFYNMWKGFAVEPKPGDWSLFKRHIEEVLCKGNPELFSYVFGWLARAVQIPCLPAETALVLRGPKGAGKGTLANLFGMVFGRHFLAVSNKRHLVGNFNFHLLDKVVLFVDEGFWAGDVQNEGVLNQLITEPLLPIEKKYADIKDAPNRLHIIMASNADWVVPVSGHERRYCVLDLDAKHAQNIDYFTAIRQQQEHGGTAAMLYDLLTYNLATFNHRQPPLTDGLRDQMVHSLRGFDAWWFNRLREGDLIQGQRGWDKTNAEQLHQHYLLSDRRHPINPQAFEVLLQKAAPGMLIAKGQTNAAKFYRLPSREHCRATWDRAHGSKENWDA